MREYQGAALAGAVLIVCSLAGCTTDESSIPPTVIPLPTVSHPPADRDEGAVLAALRQLDACALLDPAAAGVPGIRRTCGRGRRARTGARSSGSWATTRSG